MTTPITSNFDVDTELVQRVCLNIEAAYALWCVHRQEITTTVETIGYQLQEIEQRCPFDNTLDVVLTQTAAVYPALLRAWIDHKEPLAFDTFHVLTLCITAGDNWQLCLGDADSRYALAILLLEAAAQINLDFSEERGVGEVVRRWSGRGFDDTSFDNPVQCVALELFGPTWTALYADEIADGFQENYVCVDGLRPSFAWELPATELRLPLLPDSVTL